MDEGTATGLLVRLHCEIPALLSLPASQCQREDRARVAAKAAPTARRVWSGFVDGRAEHSTGSSWPVIPAGAGRDPATRALGVLDWALRLTSTYAEGGSARADSVSASYARVVDAVLASVHATLTRGAPVSLVEYAALQSVQRSIGSVESVERELSRWGRSVVAVVADDGLYSFLGYMRTGEVTRSRQCTTRLGGHEREVLESLGPVLERPATWLCGAEPSTLCELSPELRLSVAEQHVMSVLMDDGWSGDLATLVAAARNLARD